MRTGSSRAWPRLIPGALLLSLPVAILYAFQPFNAAPGTMFTGFIHSDMAYYLANARQYSESSWALFYSNPYDWDPTSPRIYFQPLIFVLGGLLRLGVEPGLLFAFVGLIATVSSFVVLQLLLSTYWPSTRAASRVILLLAAWGGGLVVIGSAATGYSLEPGDGFWFLNLGRNFVFPTEAIYHLLTLLIFLYAARERWLPVTFLALLLAASHPFTGAQYGIILAVWAITELIRRPGLETARLTALLVLPVVAVTGYYLIYLPSFPSHGSLVAQWSLDWGMGWPTLAAAYGPLAAIVGYRLLTEARTIWESPFQRLLLVASLTSLILVKHDLFMNPVQPLHFSRGHVWFPLFLLAVPVIVRAIEFGARHGRSLGFGLAIAMLVGIGLLDNVAFFTHHSQRETGIFLSENEKALFRFVDDHADSPVVITPIYRMGYLLPAYTSARPYVGHWANTPYAAERTARRDAFFETGALPDALTSECILVIRPVDQPMNISSMLSDSRTTIGEWTIAELTGHPC